VTFTIELQDDDYTIDLHYDSITLEVYRYEWYYSYAQTYYGKSPWIINGSKDWGVYQNLRAWEENTVTWNNYPRSYSKSTPEDTIAPHSHLVVGPSTYSAYAYSWDSYEITDLTRDWLDGVKPNYGVRLQPTTPGKDPYAVYGNDYYSGNRPRLVFDVTETYLDDITLEPPRNQGKDAELRDRYYADYNMGYSSYLVYAYNVYYPGNEDYYGDSNGLIEFDLSEVLPETDFGGFDSVDIDLTISNVAPSLNPDYVIMADGEEITSAKEGQDFTITDITFSDPAAEHETETFEYRTNLNDGMGWSGWSEAYGVTPGGYNVIPPEFEDEDSPSWTSAFGYYYNSRYQYMQLMPAEDLAKTGKAITSIAFKPTSYYYYVQYEWTTTMEDCEIWMSMSDDYMTLYSYSFSDNWGYGRQLVKSGDVEMYHPADSTDWITLEFDYPYVYKPGAHLIFYIKYSDISVVSNYMYASGSWQYDYYSSNMQRAYYYSDTGDYCYGPYAGGLVAKVSYDDSFDESYGIIPPIDLMYPDDNPTGTASDDKTISIELRDDDGGTSTNDIEFTVENVPPEIKPGQISIDGAEPTADILIVKDNNLYEYSGAVESTYEDTLATYFKFCDVIESTDSEFNAANMANYDFVIYLMNYQLWYYYRYSWGGWQNDYFTNSEATVLKEYLEDYEGQLWWVNTFNYGYNYAAWPYTPYADPTWPTWFFPMFGVDYQRLYYYIYSGGATAQGQGGWFDTDEAYDLAQPTDVDFSYDYYVSMLDKRSDGTSELKLDEYYDQSLAHLMVHKEDTSWGSKALISGFDLSQVMGGSDGSSSPGPGPGPKPEADDYDKPGSSSSAGTMNQEEARASIIEAVLDYFGVSKRLEVVIDEGQTVELHNFQIVDPAMGEETETFTYEINWGDGEWGPETDVGSAINPSPLSVVPPGHDDFGTGNSASYYPWNVYYGMYPYGYNRNHIHWLIEEDDLGGSATTISSFSFRPDEYYYYLDDAWSATYEDLKIYLSHSSRSGLSTMKTQNYGSDRTLVYDGTGSDFTWSHAANSEDWMEIPFDTDFTYDGTSNIVVDISYEDASYTGYRYAVGRMDAFYEPYSGDYKFLIGDIDNTYFGYYTTARPIVKLGVEAVSEQPWQAYMHTYRDNPTSDDEYVMTIHAYDDDLGHGTLDLYVVVNNVAPTISPNTVLRPISVPESGSPNVPLPAIDFDDPATQYDSSSPNEVWTYWWDVNGDGQMHNAPDIVGTMAPLTEIDNHSYGQVPAQMTTVHDDFNGRIAFYIFDDDMTHDLSSSPDSVGTTITVTNTPPVASIEVYIPMEVRVRMTGREYHDTKVEIVQTNPQNSQDVLTDELIVERMPGQPKENPFSDGTPAEPVLVKVEPWRTIEVVVTLDGRPDPNDPVHPNDKVHGSNYVNVFLDFPQEDDYDPRDDDQSDQGHAWGSRMWYNGQQSDYDVHTFDVTDEMLNKKAYLVGTSYDDGSDDAQFHWMVTSGSAPLPYTVITYYNDGSDPVVNGAFTDPSPSPFEGTAPVTYVDAHEFIYSSGFGITLYTVDDDWGVSNLASLTIP
jgi:hypothetical protein